MSRVFKNGGVGGGGGVERKEKRKERRGGVAEVHARKGEQMRPRHTDGMGEGLSPMPRKLVEKESLLIFLIGLWF